MNKHTSVRTWVDEMVLPTYLPAAPDKNPMFLEKRVYQGSSGKVYPLPFTDRIAEQPVDRNWQAVWIENEFLRVLVLPEIGGRIHAHPGQDQRLRSDLQPARHQTGAGRAGRAVDLRRHRIQLAAASSARDVSAGGLRDRGTRRRLEDDLVQRSRSRWRA